MSSLTMLKQLVEADPANATAWLLLGIEYANEGKTSDAIHAYTNALRYGDEQIKVNTLSELDKLSAGHPVNESDKVPLTNMDGDSVEKRISDTGTPNPQVLQILEGGKQGVHRAPNSVTFSDVGGLTEVKQAIEMKIIKPFRDPHLFARFKKKTGGGILLYGPPGCGKTFIARATAGECRAKFISVHISDILGMYVGESEQNLHDVFTTARAQKPSVLFFDEIDTLGYSRGKSSSQAMRGVIDQFLVEMEGVDSDTDRILIIGATNMPWDVDTAFKRPGRFDRMLFVPPPDHAARKVIFELKLSGKPTESVDLDLLAERTELYSGADIENVVEAATENVLTDILTSGVERPINMNDLLNAVSNTRPSTLEWLKTVKNYVKYANQAGMYNDVDAFLRARKL